MDLAYKRSMGQSQFLRGNATTFLTTEHFSVHHIHAGRGNPLILIHGGGVWLYSFRHNLGPLSKLFSVYAMDMPGYGFTRILDHNLPMNIGSMALAIREFMDGLAIGKASLVGHSWGGGWSLAFALACPDRVDRIVLIDSSGLDVPDVPEWELLKLPVIGRFLLKFLTLRMVRNRLEFSFAKSGLVDDAMAREVYLPMKIPANRKVQAMQARNLSWGPIERDLHRLNHPVLLIWGDRDKYLDVGLTQHFKTRIKDIRIEIIGDCGHSPHEENPDLVNCLMTEFLGEQQYSNLLPQS